MLLLAGDEIMREAILFEPVRHNNTKDVEREFNGDELTSRSMTGCLGGPYGCNGIQDTGSYAIEDTRAEHPVRVHRRALKDSTDDGPYRSESDRVDSAISIAEPAADKGTEESTGKIIDCNLLRCESEAFNNEMP